MSDSHPQDGITPARQPALSPVPRDAIVPGEAPNLTPPKKAYEQYDDHVDAAMPSLARPGATDGPGLQSLAQAARGKHLGRVRWTLFIVGGLTIAVNAFFLATNRGNVEGILQRQGINQVPPQIEELLLQDFYVGTMFLLMGGAFIALGLGVKTKPVLCTTAGLILYIVGFAITLAVNPAAIWQGIIIKIIIVVALVRAIGAARAYEAEQAQFRAAD